MKTLTHCLSKAGKLLRASEVARIRELKRTLMDDGMDAAESSAEAVLAFMQEQNDLYADVVSQIEAANGVAPDNPFDVKSLRDVKTELAKVEAERVAAEEKAKAEAEQKAEAERKKKEQQKQTLQQRRDVAIAKAKTKAQKDLRAKRYDELKFSYDTFRNANPGINWTDAEIDAYRESQGLYDKKGYRGANDSKPGSPISTWVQDAEDMVPEAADLFNSDIPAKQVYKQLFETLDKDDPRRMLAERIYDHISDNMEVLIVEKGDKMPMLGIVKALRSDGVLGVSVPAHNYMHYRGKIMLRGVTFEDSGLSYQTINHEFLHQATVELIEIAKQAKAAGKDAYEQLPKSMRDAYDQLVAVWSAVKNHPDFKFADTGIRNEMSGDIAEFVTYGLTNPYAMRKLQKIYLPNIKMSAWSRFTQSIAKLIGIKPTVGTEVNAYAALLETLDAMMESDIRRDEDLVQQVAGISTGRWDPLPGENDIPEVDVAPDNMSGLIDKLTEIVTIDQTVPLKVDGFESNTAVGTEAYGLQLTADAFNGDTTRHSSAQEVFTLRSDDENLADKLLAFKRGHSDVAFTLAEYALRVGATNKVETGNALISKRIAVAVVDEIAGMSHPKEAKAASDFLNKLNFESLEMRVVREADSFTFYNDMHLLKMLDHSTLTDAVIDAYVDNPAEFISPVIVAKIKISRPGLWSEFTDYIEGLARKPKGGLNKSPDFYTWLAQTKSPQQASAMLNDIGVKGLESADGAHYTLFDPVKTKAIVEAGKRKQIPPDNVFTAAETIGKVTPQMREQGVRLTEQLLGFGDYLSDASLITPEYQQLSKTLQLYTAAVKPFITGKDSYVSFSSMLRKFDKELLSDDVMHSLIKQDTKQNFIKIAHRIVGRSKLIEKVMALPAYTPLQSRIKDILVAQAAGDYDLAAKRSEWLRADLASDSASSVMMQASKLDSGAARDLTKIIGVSEKVLANRLQSRGGIDWLRSDIPNAQRVLGSKEADGTRFLDEQGVSEGMPLTQEQFDALWTEAVETSTPLAAELIAETKASPKPFSFWSKALQQPADVRFAYEKFVETVSDVMPDMSDAMRTKFFSLVAMSDVKSALNVIVSDTIAGTSVKGQAVTDALIKPHLQTLENYTHSGVLNYLAGLTKSAPLPTNLDHLKQFNLNMQDVVGNQDVLYTVSKFYLDLAKALNSQLAEGQQPYQTWQLQSMANPDFAAKLSELNELVAQAQKSGVLAEGQSVTEDVLISPEFQNMLRPEPQVTEAAIWAEDTPASREINNLVNALPSDLAAEFTEKVNKMSATLNPDLETLIDVTKIRAAKQIQVSDDAQKDLTKRVGVEPVDAYDGYSTSFMRDKDKSQAMFDVKQADAELTLAEMDRDERMDIKAGRKIRDIDNELVRAARAVENTPPPPNATTDADSLTEIQDRILGRKPYQKSTKQNIQEWTADFFNKDWWKEQWYKFYQYWVSDVAAIERLEKYVNKVRFGIKQRFEGSESATVLTMQAKNALVSASIANHVYGLKLVNNQIVIDDSIEGLEKLLEPIKNMGDDALRKFELWMIVQRSERLAREGKEHFVTEADRNAVNAYVNSNRALKEKFITAANKYRALNRSILQVAVDAGYINKEDAFGGYVVTETVTDSEGNVIDIIEHTLSKNRAFPNAMQADAELKALYDAKQVEERKLISQGKTLTKTSTFETTIREGWYHEDYVPFYRVNEIDAGAKPGRNQGRRLGEVKKGTKELRGGIGEINVIENMSKNIAFLVSGSLKTVAMRRVAQLGKSIAMEKIQIEGEAPLISPDQAKDIKAALGIDLDDPNMTTAEKQRWVRMLSRAAPQSKDVVVLFEDGRPTYYRVTDPLLMDALKQVGVRETVGWLHKLGMVTRILTKSITIMPGFLLRNFIRETQNTYVIDDKAAKRGYTHVMRAMQNVWRVAKDKENRVMLDMMAAGSVSYDNYFNVTPEALRKSLAKGGVDRKGMKRITGSMTDAWRMYMRMAIASEHANRLSVRENYIARRTKELESEGIAITPEIAQRITSEANFRALDVLNFSRRGAGLGADLAIAVLPFINPRIQGMDRLFRGFKENKTNFLMKMGLMSMAAMALAAHNWDENEEEMEQLKDTDKDLFYHFFWTNPDGTKDHWRVPKGFEIGQVAGTFPERIIEQFKNDQAEPLTKSMYRFLQLTFAIQAPQTIKPILEVSQNYDSFRQRPILNFGMQFKPAHMQYDVFTSHIVRDLAQSMPEWAPKGMQSPKYLQHILQGYFGPIGAMIIEAGDTMYRATGNAPDLPTKDIGQRYLIRDYYRGNVQYSSRSLDYFYEMLTESGKVAAGLKQMKEERDPRWRDEREKNRELLIARKQLNRVSKRLTKLSKEIKDIYASESMSPEQKFEEIQRLTELRNKFANEAMRKHWKVFY